MRWHAAPAVLSLGSVKELEELFGGQARLPQDGGQRAALDRPVLRDDDDPALIVPVDLMAAFGPDIGEARSFQGADDFPYWQVRERRAHAAGSLNVVTSGVAVRWPAGSSTSCR